MRGRPVADGLAWPIPSISGAQHAMRIIRIIDHGGGCVHSRPRLAGWGSTEVGLPFISLQVRRSGVHPVCHGDSGGSG